MKVQELIDALMQFPANAEMRFTPKEFCCQGYPEFLSVQPRKLLLMDGTDTGDVDMKLCDEVDQSDE